MVVGLLPFRVERTSEVRPTSFHAA